MFAVNMLQIEGGKKRCQAVCCGKGAKYLSSSTKLILCQSKDSPALTTAPRSLSRSLACNGYTIENILFKKNGKNKKSKEPITL